MWDAVADGDWGALGKGYGENVKYHGTEELSGRDAMIGLARGYKDAFPDLKFATVLAVAEGDMVSVRMRATGTNTGSLMGMPPTGKPLAVDIMQIARVENGQVVEEWETFDQLDFMQQLGVIPKRLGVAPFQLGNHHDAERDYYEESGEECCIRVADNASDRK